MTETNPWAINPILFGRLLDSVDDHADECACDTCTFINLIPAVLSGQGVEP